MKKRKMCGVVTCMLSAMLLSGCVEAPYELTEEEQNIIVSYSAHVISKYNTRQQGGLKHVWMEDESLSEIETEIMEETEIIEDTEEVSDIVLDENGNVIEEPETEVLPEAQPATLNEAFYTEGIDIAYTGCEVRENYIQDNVYSVEATRGYNYLIVFLNLTNMTDADIEVDNLSAMPTITAEYVSADGVNGRAAVYTTILTKDFSTYIGTVGKQSTEEAVLLFEIPDSITEVTDIELIVEKNENNFRIIL